MVQVLTPQTNPELGRPKIFLAGSIENGEAADWQQQFIDWFSEKDYPVRSFRNLNFTLLNPRRSDWNPDADPDELAQQILWELRCLEAADIVVFNFEAGTKSPITLLELGLFLKDTSKKIYIHCPKDFWRYMNVYTTVNYFTNRAVFYNNLRDIWWHITTPKGL